MVETAPLRHLQQHPNFPALATASRVIFAVDFDFDKELGRPCTLSAKTAMDALVRRGLQNCGIEASRLEYLRNTVIVTGSKTSITKAHSAIDAGMLMLELGGQSLQARYGNTSWTSNNFFYYLLLHVACIVCLSIHVLDLLYFLL